jgi:hypothetical protein
MPECNTSSRLYFPLLLFAPHICRLLFIYSAVVEVVCIYIYILCIYIYTGFCWGNLREMNTWETKAQMGG